MTLWYGRGGPWHGMGMSPRDVVAEAYDDLDADEPQVIGNITGQDALDGAALRRLREALPNVSVAGLTMDDAGRVQVVVNVRAPGRVARYDATGSTIAEAADKCREELGPKCICGDLIMGVWHPFDHKDGEGCREPASSGA